MSGSTTTLAELRAAQREIKRIASQRGASHVRVFGSVVRGEDRKGSDIDFLVQFKGGLFDLIGLKHDLEDYLGRPVDVCTDKGISRFIRHDILREAVSV